MPSFEELLPILRNMRRDPELREFFPLLDEMIAGAEVPDYDNIDRVLDLFTKNDMAYQCRRIAESAWMHANTHLPRKKWYEYGDDD